MSDITKNEFTVKDSFTFADESLTQDIDLCMASLDADALFTNMQFDYWYLHKETFSNFEKLWSK